MAAHANAIVQLDKVGQEMIDADHYAKETIRVRLIDRRSIIV